MRLSGQQWKELIEALIDAFPTTASLEQMLAYELDESLRIIAGEGNLEEIVFVLTQRAKTQGWLEDLVHAARQSNPRSSRLKAIADELFVTYSLQKKVNEIRQQSPQIVTKDVSQELTQPNFDPSTLWSFHHISLFLEKLLNDRQREEWLGDLEEVIYKMYKLKEPKWRFHIEILRRSLDLLKSVFFVKVNSLKHKRKLTK